MYLDSMASIIVTSELNRGGRGSKNESTLIMDGPFMLLDSHSPYFNSCINRGMPLIVFLATYYEFRLLSLKKSFKMTKLRRALLDCLGKLTIETDK